IMASIGKKILSAFVEMADEKKSAVEQPLATTNKFTDYSETTDTDVNSEKFAQYFDKLFSDANMPGPDYFEFSKMTAAMNAIPDEKSRYSAAFAGLCVQGLDKSKLLSTAAEYLRVLDTDAANFNSTLDAALQEKVLAKKQQIMDKTNRIDQLSKEINDLQQLIVRLNGEIKENESKIESNSGGYNKELKRMREKIINDVEKIKQYIH
ncbi:MAG: hypothetical protein ABI480_02475, partial [Chitinophagaceae bacterium]